MQQRKEQNENHEKEATEAGKLNQEVVKKVKCIEDDWKTIERVRTGQQQATLMQNREIK